MKSCREIDALMTPYVDGETGAHETADVDTHLGVCPSCRERANRERAVRGMVHAKAAALGERASSSLRARCIAATPEQPVPTAALAAGGSTARWRRVSGWIPLSMAAAVLVSVTAGLVFNQNVLEVAFAAQLAKDHEKCFVDLTAVDGKFDTVSAQVALLDLAGIRLTVPDESDAFDVIDVRYCQYNGGGMAHILCEWRGQPVSLFVVPGRSRRERRIETIEHNAVIWSEDDTGFALVAEQGSVEMAPVVEYVRNFAD